MKDKIEALVRKVVIDYLNKDKAIPTNKHLLIILDEQPGIDVNRVWYELKSIASKYDVSVLFSDKWSIVPEDFKCTKSLPLSEKYLDEIKDEMQKADVLIYASANYATMAKLSQTMDDTLSLWITIQMQFNGKQILLAKDFIIQKGIQKITTPFSVSKRIQSYIKTLREDRVQLIMLAHTNKWLGSYFASHIESRHVVLAKHIEEAAKLGETELIVPKNSLITPMCKDYARELRVKILQKE